MRHLPAIDVPGELVAFAKDLQRIRSHQQSLALEPQELAAANVRTAMLEGRSLLEWVAFSVHESQYRMALEKVMNTIAIHRPQMQEELKKISFYLDKIDLAVVAFKAATRDVVYFRSVAIDAGVNPDLLLFISNQAVRPFLTSYGRQYRPSLTLTLWRKPYCPLCGQPATLAQLVSDQTGRELICVYCQTNWEFHPLACPHCGNEDPEQLGCLTMDTYTGFQIHFCRICKGYIKTIDARQPLLDVMSLDEFDTLVLDIIAQQKGYVNERTGIILNEVSWRCLA